MIIFNSAAAGEIYKKIKNKKTKIKRIYSELPLSYRQDFFETGGFPFTIKDPIGEIIKHNGDQDELEQLYGGKWPEGTSYIGFITRILYKLSQYKNWDEYKSR